MTVVSVNKPQPMRVNVHRVTTEPSWFIRCLAVMEAKGKPAN